jgi:hypothetical protein
MMRPQALFTLLLTLLVSTTTACQCFDKPSNELDRALTYDCCSEAQGRPSVHQYDCIRETIHGGLSAFAQCCERGHGYSDC